MKKNIKGSWHLLRTNKKNKKKNLPIFKINIFCTLLFIIGIFSYVALMNAITSNGYKVRSIESHIVDLKAESKKIELELSDKQSIRNILAGVSRLGMVASEKVDYVSMPSSIVVKR